MLTPKVLHFSLEKQNKQTNKKQSECTRVGGAAELCQISCV
jgi:hypothetical protein